LDARPVHAALHHRLRDLPVALNILAIVQFVWLLLAREPNRFIASFGNSLSIWLAEIGRFLTAATDDKPFPWRRWPDANSPPRQLTSASS
jgi:hypothetical protein